MGGDDLAKTGRDCPLLGIREMASEVFLDLGEVERRGRPKGVNTLSGDDCVGCAAIIGVGDTTDQLLTRYGIDQP